MAKLYLGRAWNQYRRDSFAGLIVGEAKKSIPIAKPALLWAAVPYLTGAYVASSSLEGGRLAGCYPDSTAIR